MPDEALTPEDLAAAVANLQRALERAGGADLDPGLLGAIDDSLTAARRTVRRMARTTGGQARGGRRTVRAQVIEALSDLGVPASAPLISAYHQAIFESDLTAYGMASLRRDEARRSLEGEVLVVPTLTPQLAPARGLLALSTWPDWLRITGVYSERVNHLYVVRRMLDHLETLPESDADRRNALTQVLRTFGSSLDGISFNEIDIATTRAAISNQLALIEEKDREVREEAAARLGQESDLSRRMFGTPKPNLRVVGGDE
ncbi:hypothetical protein [Micromonospora parva]|uniref:hypothetical protein n=1 Tax=Micromonospora parva TaxID=1464048 RepID=UPI003407DDA2